MAAALFYVVGAACLIAAVVRATRLHRGRNRAATGAFCVLLGGLALTFFSMATPSQAWANRHLAPDLFKLIGNSSSLAAAFGAQLLLLYTSYPEALAKSRVRLRLWVLVASVTVLCAMFWLPHPAPLTGSFDGLYAVDPTLVVYTAVYALYLGAVVLDLMIMFWSYSRETDSRWLSVGLRVLSVAAALGLVYAASKITVLGFQVVTRSRATAGDANGVCHAAFDSVGCVVAVGLPGMSTLLTVLGVLICALARRTDRLTRWASQRRTYRLLHPLWKALTQSMPELVASHGDIRGVDEVGWRLAERIGQIHDGLLLIAPYRNAALAAEAHDAALRGGLPPSKRAAVVEATQIRAAINARDAGEAPLVDAPPAPDHHNDDWTAESDWLVAVSRALASSPIVRWIASAERESSDTT